MAGERHAMCESALSTSCLIVGLISSKNWLSFLHYDRMDTDRVDCNERFGRTCFIRYLGTHLPDYTV